MSLGHTHSHHSPASGVTLFWVIVFNVAITLAEFVAGLLTGSLALIADAAHNLSDVAALVLAYYGERASQAPATKRSTYGRKRAEVVTALISAISLLVIAGFILYEAYQRFIHPPEIGDFPLFITVALIGLFGNVASVWILRRDNAQTINRRTALLHLIYDALSSVAVIIGGVFIFTYDLTWLDPALSALIAGMLIWSTIDVLKEGGGIIMESAPAHLDFDEIMRALEGRPFAINVHDLHIWSLSSTETALSCHVTVAPEALPQMDSIVRDLNKTLAERFGVTHATIQVESSECSRPDDLCNHVTHEDRE